MDFWKEFFRVTTHYRGEYFGWQHILFSSIITLLYVVLAIIFGRKYRNADEKAKRKPMIVALIIYWGVQLVYYISCLILKDFKAFVEDNLPLFLCDIQLFTVPIAIFGKGKVRTAALDFCVCLGILSALMGAWFNAAVFSNNPIWSFDCIWNYVNHCAPGFIALYIPIVGMSSMKLKDIWITFLFLGVFEAIALVFDLTMDANYMFFDHSSGTPFFIFEDIAQGNQAIYVTLNILAMNFYIFVYYLGWMLVSKLIAKKKAPTA